jgi:hypothetical protein
MKMSYRKGKVNYNRDRIYPTESISLKQKRRSFKQWLRDYLKEDDHVIVADAIPSTVGTDVFNKSFEGWQIRLHKANGGHIVEAWKNEDTGPTMNYRRPHELFFVNDSSDMGASINDILVQLMLRG